MCIGSYILWRGQFVFVIFYITCCASSEKEYELCGHSDFTRSLDNPNQYYMVEGHRLVGGKICEPNAWPWTVQIIWKSGKHRCGGALIDSKFVVTAAHCFSKSRDPTAYRVLVGGHKTGTGEVHDIRNITIHPLFNVVQPSSYDIALIRLDTPAELCATVRKICLPMFPIAENKICIVTGWGYESEKGKRSGALKEIHVPILSPLICNDAQHYQGRLHPPSMLCAGYTKGEVDACQGDSGGPLFCEVGGRWELHGIVSWGNGCARPFNPGVYARVSSAVSWIQLQMLLIG